MTSKFDKCLALALHGATGEAEAVAAFLSARRLRLSGADCAPGVDSSARHTYFVPFPQLGTFLLKVIDSAEVGRVRICAPSWTTNEGRLKLCLEFHGSPAAIDSLNGHIDRVIIPALNA